MYDVHLSQSLFPAQPSGRLEPMTIGGLLSRQAAALRDKPALKELRADGSIAREWTYGALHHDAMRLARALAARHAPGSRIAVYAPNIPEWVLLELAAGIAGLTLVTVNPAYQRRELRFVLEQSRSEAIYYVGSFRGNPIGEIANSVCDELEQVRVRVLLTDHRSLFEGEEDGVLPVVTPDAIAQIQYTSGTTGFPKGALLHHFGLVQNARDTIERVGCGADDIVVHHMPLFHTTGCAVILLGFLGIGGTLLLAPIFDPVMIADVIARERATFIFGVPTMIVALLEEIERSGRDVSSVRGVGSGGAMVAPELARKCKAVFGSYITIIYGQTEASPVITAGWRASSIEDATQTIGQPLPHVEVSIRDVASNSVCPLGVQGEICARGYLVMAGYNDNPAATAAAIDGDGWLHTGDLGTIDARGFVRITGRVKEMIIRGGENLFPVEIENALLEHPSIAECAVVGVADPKWGEQVACFIRPATELRPTAADLKAFIRERLSPQKTPAYWIYLETWPLTGSGKIQKFKLAEGFAQGAYVPLKD